MISIGTGTAQRYNDAENDCERYDVNGSSNIDFNDAQLVYDIVNGRYTDLRE